jgi:predicted O-methyltransferase YrrM
MPSAADFDALVNDPRFGEFRGWHDDYPGISGDAYKPAIQQDRGEFLALAAALAERDLNGRCLQLGLGHAGGSHRLFEAIFREVWTIDFDPGVVAAFAARFPESRHLICGDARDPAIRDEAWRRSPFDFLFIDAGHLYADVAADWRDYGGMVRPGGIIAFHDAVQVGPGVEVHKLLAELTATGKKIHTVGSDIGTAWMVME